MKLKYLLLFLALNIFYSCKKNEDPTVTSNIDAEPSISLLHNRLNKYGDSIYIAPVEISFSGYANIKDAKDVPTKFTLKINDSILTTNIDKTYPEEWQVTSNYKFNESGTYSVTFTTEFPTKTKEKTIQIKVAEKVKSVNIKKIKIDRLDNILSFPATLYFIVTSPIYKYVGDPNPTIDTLFSSASYPRVMTNFPLLIEPTNLKADLSKYKSFEVRVIYKSGIEPDGAVGWVRFSEYDYGSNTAINPYPESVTREDPITGTQATFYLEWN